MAAGLVMGAALTPTIGWVLAAWARGVEPQAPGVLAVTFVALAGAAMGAAWLPARRALSVDPVESLRAE